MKLKLLLLFLFIVTSFFSFSQEKAKIDSLNNILKKKIHDTVRIKTLLDLAIRLQDTDINLSSNTANTAYKLIKKNKYNKVLSHYYLIKCREYNFKSDFKNALHYANLAHDYSLKEKNERKHLTSIQYKALVINANNMDFKASIKFLNKKIDSINKKNKIVELADVYFSLASSYSRDNKFNSAIKNFITAIKIYDANNEPYGIRNCYFEICDIYTYTGDYNNALLYSNKIFELAKKHKLDSKRDQTLDLAKAGEIQLKLGNFKKAEALLSQSFKYCNEIGDEFNRIYIVTNIIQNNLELKKYENAILLCKNELKREKLNNELTIVFYNFLASTYTKTNNLKLAKLYIEKALAIIIKNDIDLLKYGENISIYDNAAKIYFELKDYKKAYFYLDKYNNLSEKINSEYTAQKVETIQAEFNLIDKELEIKNLKLKEQAKNIQLANQLKNIYFAIIIILIFVATTILIFIVYRNSRKNNKALKNKNEIIVEKNKLLQKAISEKDLLIREIHHRVKNNLQLVMSLLNIQSRKNKNKEINEFIEKSQVRINSIALIHQNLYNSPNLSKVNFNDYLEQLLSSIISIQTDKTDKINFNINTNKISFDVQTAIPLGLILNELISNSLKYAFPNDEEFGQINISLIDEGKNEYCIFYEDNGIGYSDSEIKSSSIGIKLVTLLTEQLNGNISHSNDDGTKYKITFTEIINNTL